MVEGSCIRLPKCLRCMGNLQHMRQACISRRHWGDQSDEVRPRGDTDRNSLLRRTLKLIMEAKAAEVLTYICWATQRSVPGSGCRRKLAE